MMSTATTLSQWHMRTISGWISMPRWSALMARTLHLPPGRRAALVLEHDAAFQQFLANPVSFGEVLVLARGLPGCDSLVDPSLLHASRRGAQERIRLPL